MSTPSGQVGQDNNQTHEPMRFTVLCSYVQPCKATVRPIRLHTILGSMDLGRGVLTPHLHHRMGLLQVPAHTPACSSPLITCGQLKGQPQHQQLCGTEHTPATHTPTPQTHSSHHRGLL